MNQKHPIGRILPILIALALVASTWQSAFAAAFVTANSYEPGRQGVFMPGGLSPDFIEVTKVSQKEIAWSPIRFNRPLLMIDFVGDEAGLQTTDIDLGSQPTGLTYVFFVLNQKERRDWEDGDLSIWYRDESTGTWQQCSAFVVNNGTGETTEDGDDGVQDTRVACVAPQYTLFGLGTPR